MEFGWVGYYFLLERVGEGGDGGGRYTEGVRSSSSSSTFESYGDKQRDDWVF